MGKGKMLSVQGLIRSIKTTFAFGHWCNEKISAPVLGKHHGPVLEGSIFSPNHLQVSINDQDRGH